MTSFDPNNPTFSHERYERCDDIIVYMILFKAMIEERRIVAG